MCKIDFYLSNILLYMRKFQWLLEIYYSSSPMLRNKLNVLSSVLNFIQKFMEYMNPFLL